VRPHPPGDELLAGDALPGEQRRRRRPGHPIHHRPALGHEQGIAARQKVVGWDDTYLLKILSALAL
jgi:hypothetical protein